MCAFILTVCTFINSSDTEHFSLVYRGLLNARLIQYNTIQYILFWQIYN